MSFYKTCIRSELERRLERNPRYSLRAFARALGLDAAALSRILGDKVVPSYKVAQKILAGMDLLPQQQAEFLQSLSEAHRSKNTQRMSRIFKNFVPKAGTDHGAKPGRELSADLFRVISDWYHYAILELTYLPRFKAEPQWIASQLGISAMEAKLAIERLVNLGLLEQKDGTYRKTDALVATADKQITTPALRRRQRQILEKAIHSLENDPIESRNNYAMTMAIDRKKIPEAKELIRKFGRELCALLESGDRTDVYELSVSLFPLQTRRDDK